MLQKTNFPFEIIIHDDASTDGTSDIIRKHTNIYPNVIIPIIQLENQYSIYHNFNRILQTCFNKCRGKYIALCEGDDYRTDPYKLQKQVDFLESHPEYTMCFHNAISHWENGEQPDSIVVDFSTSDISPVELYARWQAPTASILFRSEITKSDIYLKSINIPKAAFGDIQIGIACGILGKIYYINECMSVYRRLSTGAACGISNNPWPHIRTRLQLSKIYGKDFIKVDKKYTAIYFFRALKKPLAYFPNNIYIIFRLLCFTPFNSLKELKWLFKSMKNKFTNNA